MKLFNGLFAILVAVLIAATLRASDDMLILTQDYTLLESAKDGLSAKDVRQIMYITRDAVCIDEYGGNNDKMPSESYLIDIKNQRIVNLDHDNKQLSVEGPMEDDTHWITAVDAAQQAGRDVTCVRGDGINTSAIAASAVALPGGQPTAALFDISPLVTAQFGRADASQVESLKITVRTPVEVRSFAFVRKDKVWTDLSGLQEFQIDGEHVNAVAELVARLDMNRVIQVTGGAKPDQKLTAKDASVLIEAVMADRRPITVTIGANFESLGFYTQASTWPGAVFLLNPDRVAPLLRGAAYFAKERVAAN